MKNTLLFSVIAAVCCLLFVSCSPSADITVFADGSGTVSFRTSAGAAAEKAVQGFLGTGDTIVLFDRERILESVSASNLSVESLSFPSESGIDITLKAPKLDKVIPLGAGFMSVKSATEKGKSVFTLNITPTAAAQMLVLMPSETSDYAELLMAPLFTGEIMSAQKYTELVAAVYGGSLAKELSTSVLTVTVSVPGTVVSASIRRSDGSVPGTVSYSGGKAVFVIPAAALLSETNGISCTIMW